MRNSERYQINIRLLRCVGKHHGGCVTIECIRDHMDVQVGQLVKIVAPQPTNRRAMFQVRLQSTLAGNEEGNSNSS